MFVYECDGHLKAFYDIKFYMFYNISDSFFALLFPSSC